MASAVSDDEPVRVDPAEEDVRRFSLEYRYRQDGRRFALVIVKGAVTQRFKSNLDVLIIMNGTMTAIPRPAGLMAVARGEFIIRNGQHYPIGQPK